MAQYALLSGGGVAGIQRTEVFQLVLVFPCKWVRDTYIYTSEWAPTGVLVPCSGHVVLFEGINLQGNLFSRSKVGGLCIISSICEEIYTDFHCSLC